MANLRIQLAWARQVAQALAHHGVHVKAAVKDLGVVHGQAAAANGAWGGWLAGPGDGMCQTTGQLCLAEGLVWVLKELVVVVPTLGGHDNMALGMQTEGQSPSAQCSRLQTMMCM